MPAFLLDAGEALQLHLTNEIRTYELQAAIFKEALLSCLPITNGLNCNLFLLYIFVIIVG